MNPATFCLAAPLLVMAQPTRPRAFVASLAVHLFASHDILSTGEFLRASNISLSPWLLWLAAAALQSVPWTLFWGRLPFRVSIAVLVSAIPPFGIIGWNSALHGAGMLFPGMGAFGIICTLALLDVALLNRIAMTAVVVLISVVPAHTARTSLPSTPRDWAAVRTAYGDIFNHPKPLDLLEAVDRLASESSAKVVAFPESMIPRWTDATPLFFSSEVLRSKTLIVGTTLSRGPRGYRNIAIVTGRDAHIVDQRIPVPIAMWRPWTDDGVALDLWSSPVRRIAGVDAAVLVCYEQLLPWSYLTLLVRRVDTLAGISNVYWVRRTRIPGMQSRCLESWARLMGVPYLEAVNR